MSEALGASVLLPIRRGNDSDGREAPQPQSGDPHPQSRRHAFIHPERISGSSEHPAEGASEHPPLAMPRSPASEGEDRGASLPEVAQEVIKALGRSPQCWHWHLAVDVWPAGALPPRVYGPWVQFSVATEAAASPPRGRVDPHPHPPLPASLPGKSACRPRHRPDECPRQRGWQNPQLRQANRQWC